MKFFAVALFLVITAACGAQTAPTADGVYLRTGSQWATLYTATSIGTHVSGTGRAMLTGGISRINGSMIYRDSTSPVSTQDPVPVFCVIGTLHTAPRDIVIVRLKQKRDHRELQMASVGAFRGPDIEYPPKDTVHVSVSQSGACKILSPVAPLTPGEYILFAGTGVTPITFSGYGGNDFSVAASKVVK